MTGVRKRMGVLFLGAALPLVLASAAYACASLATLSINPERGRPGATISGSGANYCSDPSCSEVSVHFKGRSGPLLATVRPGADRKIAFEFKVPKAAPGWYSIVAVQRKADGSPVAGTPGRDSLRVRATSSSRGNAIPPVWSSDQTPPGAEAAPVSSGIEIPVSSGSLLLTAALSLVVTIGLGLYWKSTGKLDATTSA